MKKRGALAILVILAFSLFIALIPEAFSIYGEKVYSGSVEDRKTVDIKGIPFTFVVDQASSKVYAEFSSSGVIVPSFECRTKESFRICAKNISFSRRISNESRDVYKADIEITLIKSKIEVSHSISKQSILIDEEATAELKVQNTADISAKNLIAAIEIPSNLVLGEVEGCKKLYSRVILADEITPTEIKTCSYKLTGLAAGDFELKPEIAYFDGVEAVNATSVAVQGKVYNRSLKISQFLNKSSFDIGEKFNLALNIENTNNEHDLDISLMNLKLPEGILLIKKPKEFSKNNNILTWGGHLAPKEAASFIMELQSYSTGNYSILVESVYKESKFLRSSKDRLGIEVYCNCPAIQHELAPASFEASQPVRLTARLSNPSPTQDFSNVGISYKSSIPKIKSGSFNYGKISPLGIINIVDSSFAAPLPGQIYELNITAKYSSASQPFILRKNIVIASLSSAAEVQQNQSQPAEIGPIESQSDEESDESDKSEEAKEAEESESKALESGAKDAAGVPEEAQEIVQEDVLELSSGSSSVKKYLLLAAVALLLAVLTAAFILRKAKSKGGKDAALHETGLKPSTIKIPEKDKIFQISEEKEKRHSFREMLELMREPLRRKAEIKTTGNARRVIGAGNWKEDEIKKLEEEIKKLGNIFERKKEEKGILGILKRKWQEKRERAEEERQRKEKPGIAAKINGKSSGFIECHRLLLKGQEALSKNNIAAAKSAYLKANSIYTNLGHNEKKELYNIIINLYNKLKSA